VKRIFVVFLVCAFSLAFAAENAAQFKEAAPPAIKKELVKLKFVTGNDIIPLIQPFLVDLRYERINMDSSKKILTLSATPENIELMKQVIREVDVKPADLLFTVQLILGSETEAGSADPIQNDPLIKELRGLLRYKSYTLLDSSMVRVVNKENAEVVLGPKAEFEFALRPEVSGDTKAPVVKTQVRLRKVELLGSSQGKPITNVATLIESTLNIKSGERTVVGVSKLDGGDKGLILIISGKIID
jgi:hypothetical protein